MLIYMYMDIIALCSGCMIGRDSSLYRLRSRLLKLEKKNVDLHTICRSCESLGQTEEVSCDSKDCPVFYSRIRQAEMLAADRRRIEPAIKALEDLNLDW